MIGAKQAMISIRTDKIRRKKNYIDNNNDNTETAAIVTAIMAGETASPSDSLSVSKERLRSFTTQKQGSGRESSSVRT
jgi:hypothetical protein